MQKQTDNIYILVIIAMLGSFILVISFILLLYRSRQKLMLQREKERMNELEYQKALLRSVIESQEAERTRIGRDLHDDVGNALSNLHIITERFFRSPYNASDFSGFQQSVKSIVADTIQNVRNISHNLSPEILTLNSTSEAIEDLCYTVNQADKLQLTLQNHASQTLDQLELNSSLSVYRIIEELITNTIKHAGATAITLTFSASPSALTISYADNGKGLTKQPERKKGRGLYHMESRAELLNATLVFPDQQQSGFAVLIEIPI